MSSSRQYLLTSGPMPGPVAALSGRMPEVSWLRTKDEVARRVIAVAPVWHRSPREHYFIAPGQFFIQERLAIPVAWGMIFVILGLVGTGIRSDLQRRHRFRRDHLGR
jgi:hypothetical protein